MIIRVREPRGEFDACLERSVGSAIAPTIEGEG